jgi:hypothetical protein
MMLTTSAAQAQPVEAFYRGKTHAEFGPLHGVALQKSIEETRNVPPAVLERARAAVRR